MTYKCTLWPSGEVIELNGEETLLKQLKGVGKKIKSSCGGCATCGDCMIVVKSGELNLTPQTFEELRLLGNVYHITKERLSCQTKVSGDITIDITHHDKSTTSTPAVPKSTKTVVRKREEIEKSVREYEEKAESKPADTWYKHWEQEDSDPNQPKKFGGNKRPKPFRYNETDISKDTDDENNK